MYVWRQSNLARDNDFPNDIIVHEYSHGILTRLTGGPTNSGCLNNAESGGYVKVGVPLLVYDFD
jgi:extracellular elastinolytic metalloproteinase